ncbi:MAG: hypothetical protein P8X81_09390 [Woeseiaceae bacterium]|jgi:hypothetical protein
MFLRASTFLGLAVAAAVIAAAEPGARLGIEAEPAVAKIRPFAEGRRLVHLPALEYQLNLDTHCGESAFVQSVSISVNDTQITLNSDHVANVAGEPVGFTIPARQVAPVAIDGFCVEEDSDSQQAGLLIRDTVTVHLSLRCKNETREWITYASRGLDVTLLCDVAEPDQSVTSTDR